MKRWISPVPHPQKVNYFSADTCINSNWFCSKCWAERICRANVHILSACEKNGKCNNCFIIVFKHLGCRKLWNFYQGGKSGAASLWIKWKPVLWAGNKMEEELHKRQGGQPARKYLQVWTQYCDNSNTLPILHALLGSMRGQQHMPHASFTWDISGEGVHEPQVHGYICTALAVLQC
jgi:hypothetical protein